MKSFHTLSVLAGLILLGLLVRHTGLAELWHDMASLGWGLAPLILIQGVAELFHALGLRACLGNSHKSMPFSRIFSVHMSGFAINYLTPTATVGGDVIKWALLSSNHTGMEAATGVLVGKLSQSLAQLLLVASGSILTLWMFPLPPGVWPAMLTGSALLGSGIVGFLLVQRSGRLGTVVRFLVAHRIGGKSLEKVSHHITQVDGDLKLFYRERPRDLPISISWHIMGYLCGIAQSWYFLYLLTDRVSLPLAAGIWFLGSWFDLLLFAVPMGVGVVEGTRVLAFKTLGFDIAMGLAYGVTLRLQQVFWSGFGLLRYAILLSEIGEEGSFHIKSQNYLVNSIAYSKARVSRWLKR